MHLLVAMSLGMVLAQAQEPAPVRWSVTPGQSLVWDGQPYVPYGVRVVADPATIRQVAALGVQDVVVELPASGIGWKDAIAALEASKLRYLISISSTAPQAVGFSVDPQGNRVTGIITPRKFDLSLPATDSALSVLVARRDSALIRYERTPVINGRLTFEAKVNNGLEHAVIFYPETQSLEQIDFWEGFDAQRDNLITSFKRNPPGPGFRGLVNPLGQAMELPSKDMKFVPSSPFFRIEFRNLLESRYKNLETAMRSWSMSSAGVMTFDDLARLVPLWLGQRGISQMWDPKTNKLWACDMRRSLVWTDIRDALNMTAARRTGALVRTLRAQLGVPVVQEWTGWSPLVEGDQASFDGLAMTIPDQKGAALLAVAGRPTSSLMRWNRPGWSLATDIAPIPGEDPAWASRLEDLSSLGVRGWFIRSTKADEIKAFMAEAERLHGEATSQDPLARPLFFPENALNPATVQRLPGGRWWLPSPADGNRLDFGSLFSGYRMLDGNTNTYVIWSRGGAARTKLRLKSVDGMRFDAVDGSDPVPKVVKGGVEIFLGEMPMVISGTSEIPVPEEAFRETVFQFDSLIKESEKLKRDMIEERTFFKDGIDGFEQNPGGSLPTMREQLIRAGSKFADYTWVEGESAREHSFSEALARSGCSGGFVLQLRTPLVVDAVPYFANYVVPVRSPADQDVWIAARIPKGSRQACRLVLGSQTMRLTTEPVSIYGDGYGWYRLGVTRLAGTSSRLRVEIDPAYGLDVAIDAILLTPRPFRPDGPVRPNPIEFGALPAATGKKG